MTRYQPVDAFTILTQGVLTLPLRDPDDEEAALSYTDDSDQTDLLNDLQELHPEVGLADWELLPSPSGEWAQRVRCTVPGEMCDADDRVTWWQRVPEELGHLDADAHMFTLGEREKEGLAIRGGLERSLDLPRIATLKNAYDTWSPPLTLALVHDARGLLATTRGLWLTLAPLPRIVPLGFNLAAFETTRHTRTNDASREVFRATATKHYRKGLLETLTATCTARRCCPCGRFPDEHIPTDEQLRAYLDIAAGPAEDPYP
ncbi:hypothetical protein [Embleya sp. NPDC059237]|uniref:hypothetical protein n=1 Tax=Embleya sp. NPDC059237 TaxID=3346784 RepID=UPI0036C12AD9